MFLSHSRALCLKNLQFILKLSQALGMSLVNRRVQELLPQLVLINKTKKKSKERVYLRGVQKSIIIDNSGFIYIYIIIIN